MTGFARSEAYAAECGRKGGTQKGVNFRRERMRRAREAFVASQSAELAARHGISTRAARVMFLAVLDKYFPASPEEEGQP
jgi:hypothetical protein